MKDLPYFKFATGEWLKGDIVDCSMKAQGLFINICTLYWSKGCNLTLTRVQRKFNTCLTEITELVKDEIFIVNEDEISIDFLDDQFGQFEELAEKKSRAGKASAKKRKTNTRSTGVKHVLNKEDKIKEDKIPAIEEFLAFALSKKDTLDKKAIECKYESWKLNNWKDGNDNQIKNWKSKLLNTIPFLAEASTKKEFRPYDRK